VSAVTSTAGVDPRGIGVIHRGRAGDWGAVAAGDDAIAPGNRGAGALGPFQERQCAAGPLDASAGQCERQSSEKLNKVPFYGLTPVRVPYVTSAPCSGKENSVQHQITLLYALKMPHQQLVSQKQEQSQNEHGHHQFLQQAVSFRNVIRKIPGHTVNGPTIPDSSVLLT